MAHSYSVDAKGNVYKNGQFVSADNYKYLQQDPNGQQALSAAKNLKSGGSGYSGWSTSKGWVGGSNTPPQSTPTPTPKPKTNTTSSTQIQPKQQTQQPQYAPNNMQEILAQMGGTLSQYQMPYEQAYRDVISQAPIYNAPSEQELLSQAGTWAGLQIDPQVQALNDAIEKARLSAQTQEDKINANYASFDSSVDRMVQKAEQRALESAIARGGGRSGAVEWLSDQYAAPIMEQAATQQAGRTASLNSIANALALAEEQYRGQGTALEARRGELEAQRVSELQALAQAQASGNWERVATATQNLMNMATQAQQFEKELGTNHVQYFMPTFPQQMDYNTNVLNSVPEITDDMTYNTPSLTSPVTLRDYATNQGATVGYDPATKSVIINGKKYSTSQLQQMGGQLVNGSWMIPQNAIDGLF